jgi:EpsI family protein
MSDKTLTRRAVMTAIAMAVVAGGSQSMVPTRRMSVLRGPFRLETLVPANFGDWQTDTHTVSGIVNPEATALLDRIYSQLLDRVYFNATGQRIMLSIAYGDDQADDTVQLHYPEICYPAQGFQVKGNRTETLELASGALRVRRLQTRFGDARFEPVTYWTIIGDEQSLGGWDRKVAEIKHGLRGEIVDGLLFRVSSIDRDTPAAFRLQDVFIRDIVAAMAPSSRRQLVGLS